MDFCIEKCPFWKYRTDAYIVCQGPVVNTTIAWNWDTKADADKQVRIFCRDQYERCEIYRCVIQNRSFD